MHRDGAEVTTLVGPELAVRIDPIGCRIASVVHRGHDREVLFVAPWPRHLLGTGPATNERWVAHWPGGWDVLTPNAGAPSDLAGIARGFHGEASVEPWEIEVRDDTTAVGRWRDRSGLTVERSIRVDGPRVRVANDATNPTTAPVPFVWVEHLILDADLLGAARLDLSGRAVALDDTRRATDGWDAAAPWPTVRNAGRDEDWGRLPPAGSARMGSVRDTRPPVRVAGEHGLSLRLDWSVTTLPYLWVWIEHAASAALPGGHAINCVGLEPANTASGDGVAAGLARGDGHVLAPGDAWSSWVELHVDVTPAG
jgi:hypothetical protein